MLHKGKVATNPIIQTEILTGARSDQEFIDLKRELASLHKLSFTNETWELVSDLRYQMNHRGNLISLSDVVIATSALLANAIFYHCNRHFNTLAVHTKLRTMNSKK